MSGVVSPVEHRIDVQPDQVNRGPQRLGTDQQARRSLPVEVVMHASVVDDDARTTLLVNGRILQALFDHRRLADPHLEGSLAATGTELFGLRTLDRGTTRTSCGQVCTPITESGPGLRVSGVLIDSDLEAFTGEPVTQRVAKPSQIMEMA